MALTMTQIKEICDYVYNQSTTYDVYTSNNNPMRLYYITVSSQGAKIYKKGEDIVTIFGKRNLPYTDGTEIKSYTADVVYNALAPTATEEKVNFKGIGANISVKTLIRNIGVFLGVKIAANIDKVNPTMYNEMVEICRSHVDNVNKIPYFLAKDTHNGVTYQSFIPLDILVDIAVYLNNSGIFESQTEIFNTGAYYALNQTLDQTFYDNNKQYILTLNEMYPDNYDKATYYEKAFRYFDDGSGTARQEAEQQLIDAFVATFDSLINYTDNVVMMSMNVQPTGTSTIRVREFPKTCYIEFGGQNLPKMFRNGSDASSTFHSTFHVVNKVEDFIYNYYTLQLTHSTGVITQSHNIYEYVKDTLYQLNPQYNQYNWFTNVKFTNNYKKYMGEFLSSSSQYSKALDYYGELSSNVAYDREVIKLCGLTTLYMSSMCVTEIIKSTITDLDLENDLLILAYNQNTYGKKCLLRFKNLSSIKASSEYILNTSPSVLRQAYRATNASSWTYDDKIMYYASRYTPITIYITGITLQFGRPTEIERYDIDTTGTTVTIDFISSEVTQNYTIPYYDEDNTVRLRLNCTNLGSVVQHEVIDTYAGIELESGANYPTTVVDEQSFRTYYNNRIYNDVGNPDILEGEVVSGVRDITTFVNCSVSETPPASQADSEDWDIDDATPEDQEKIAEDVDSSANDEDEDEDSGDNDDGKDDATDSGEVEEIPAEYVPSTLVGCLRQYKMNASEMISFSNGLSSLDFSDVVEALIFGNPVNGVINCAATYDGLWNSTNSQDNTQVRVWNNALDDDGTPVTATLVANAIKEIDLGTINLATNTEIQEFIHDNYTDLTDCEISLYLPFVGIINIDIHDFYKKELTLKARVDSTTGTIIYNVYSSGTDFKHLIYTCSGNCQSKIPLKSEDMSQLLRNIGNAAAGVGGAMLGGIV